MNESFEKEFYLRTSDFDCRMDLQPSAVLDLFQDVAGEHARALGIGRDAMLESNLIWVIVRARYRVLRTPKQFDRVRVRTWPLPPRRSIFQRDYRITDENQEVIAIGSSEWVVIHSERRRIVPVGDVYPLKDGFLEEHSFLEGFSRLSDFDASGGVTVAPRFTDLDVNGHVNNIKYANYVMDAISPTEAERVREFEIEYHREVRGDCPLTVALSRTEGRIDAKGIDADGQRMFTARITLA